jgi:intraflagellar transport protein 172
VGADLWQVVFYDNEGGVMQQFDFSEREDVREFTTAQFNPSGETVVVGSFNSFYLFSYNSRRGLWEEAGVKHIENFYSVTALAWRPDGSRLGVGSLCGGVDLYDACIRRHRYKGKFEFTYVSKSQVIVQRLSTKMRIVLKSSYGYEVERINIHKDTYLTGHTPETLLLGDIETCKLSEIPWAGSGSEKFVFDNPQVRTPRSRFDRN